MSRQEQYRPSFNMLELEELLSYIPQQSKLYGKLRFYITKVSVGITSASYIKTGAQAERRIEVQLGMEPAETPEAHTARQKKFRETLELRATIAPMLMSDEDRLEYLGQKSLEDNITPEEAEEGKALELKIHGMNFGMFD